MSAPPASRILSLHEPEAAPVAARDHRALWRGQSAGPEAEAEASEPSPHYLIFRTSSPKNSRYSPPDVRASQASAVMMGPRTAGSTRCAFG